MNYLQWLTTNWEGYDMYQFVGIVTLVVILLAIVIEYLSKPPKSGHSKKYIEMKKREVRKKLEE